MLTEAYINNWATNDDHLLLSIYMRLYKTLETINKKQILIGKKKQILNIKKQ